MSRTSARAPAVPLSRFTARHAAVRTKMPTTTRGTSSARAIDRRGVRASIRATEKPNGKGAWDGSD